MMDTRRPTNLPVMLALIVVMLAAPPAVANSDPAPEWRHLAFAPDQATLYLHVRDGATLRRNLAQRPLGQWILGEMEQGQFWSVWSRIAQRAGLDEGELFDLTLGRSVTLIRTGPLPQTEANESGNGNWTVITQLPKRKGKGGLRKVLRGLRPETRPPMHGLAVYALPEHDLLTAVGHHHLLVAPLSDLELFEHVVEAFVAQHRGEANERDRAEGKDEASTPADGVLTAALQAAEELSEGQIAILLRHETPLGGWSIAAGTLRDECLTLQHRSQFDHAPFSRPTTSLEIDASVVDRFAQRSLLAIVEPTDIGPTPLERIVHQTIGEPLIGGTMSPNIGSRRLHVIGESEGRLDEEAVDILRATYALVVEADEAGGSEAQLDQQMTRWSEALKQRMDQSVEGSRLICVPPAGAYRDGRSRQVNLEPVTDALTGGFPIMHVPSLNWAVAHGPNGAWYVITTEPTELKQVVSVLEDAPVEGDEGWFGAFDSAGVLSGGRIARHLESWLPHVEAIAQPGNTEVLREEVTKLGELAAGVDAMRWRMHRPCRDSVEMEVEVDLAPPISEGP